MGPVHGKGSGRPPAYIAKGTKKPSEGLLGSSPFEIAAFSKGPSKSGNPTEYSAQSKGPRTY